MPKQIRLITTAVVLNILAFAGLFQPPSGLSEQNPQATTTASRNAALIAATSDVLKETSEIRQLAILRPVQSSTQSRPEIERMLIKNIDEETTPGQMYAAEVTLKRLGLAPPEFQFRALMLRVLTEQVAGYYDPKTREFHLADWIDLDGQRPVMAHELTHALQDQHFNLRRFEHWPKGDSDAELATRSLIEGDATLAMALYVANNPLRVLLFLKSLGTMGMASQELDKAPRALRETLLFPYQEGINWTKTLYKQAGWDRVSKAFTDLPQSTEQILHPDKYFAHEAPVKVTLPDLTPLLNAGSVRSAEVRGRRLEVGDRRSGVSRFAGNADVSSALSAQREQLSSAATRRSFSSNVNSQTTRATWKRLDYDVEGEWGFYLILDEFLKSPAESRRAAAGWGGDRFAVYEGPKGEVLFASLSIWDTENDAREFFDAYVKRTELRYPTATPTGPLPNAQSPTASKTFSTSDGEVTIELRGNRVAVLEGPSNRLNSKSVLEALLTGLSPKN
ncbi:MAG: hypothetical protein QOH70_3892 [Blastocatellia bacterium]|jgi:hypothetical protein|nr:hypothetical protein [Blastocatellia bacterium]